MVSIGRTITGHTTASDLADGVEIQIDIDVEGIGDGDILHLTTGGGRQYDFFGPELEEGIPGVTFNPRPWAALMPRIEMIGPKLLRLRLTEGQEGILKGP